MAANTQTLDETLSGYTNEQLLEGIELESASDKEETDWLNWLKNDVSKKSSPNFFSKYGFVLIGVGIFCLVLFVWNRFSK